ncbi:hypothetical protein K3725_14215 [Leisingera sp. S132]|uniref:hypothetical protein n=1 Tax=Leisingera sp. S132 TaxID=2867016 RepID=UPI0021A29774|nr:hypothetical protein [Leisingera sp. S132]UWQ78455.1 hypothetical protein K3725_14215 [Leisingera sp. S132]
MKTMLSRFLSDEHGAVTVDWVVLTASVVGLGAMAVLSVTDGVRSLRVGTGAYLEATAANAKTVYDAQLQQ